MTGVETILNLDNDISSNRKVRVDLNSPPPAKQSLKSEEMDSKDNSDQETSKREIILKSNPEPITIQSSIVQINRTRSRIDASRDLTNVDRQRSKRMFGFLQGTLAAAKKENDDLNKSEIGKRRREIQQRIEKKEQEEREKMKQERLENFKNRRANQTEFIINSRKEFMIAEFERWKSNTLKMIGHIMTTTSPQIFYLPARENNESKRRLEQTENLLLDKIYHREQKLKVDIEEMKKRMTERLTKNIQDREKKADSEASHDETDEDDEEFSGELKSSIALPTKKMKHSGSSSSGTKSSSGTESDSDSESSASQNGGNNLASTVTKV